MRFPPSIYATWLVVGLANSPTYGMTFSTKLDPEHGINVIVAEGPILQGDASRLEKIIPLAGRDEFGNIPIYLNSRGVPSKLHSQWSK